MRVVVVAVVAVVADATPARADDWNWFVGPYMGIAWGRETTPVFGIEGGPGYGVQRLNAGIGWRDFEGYGYVEIDPWWLIGLSAGVGYGSDRGVEPVFGVWEGMPLELPGCDDTERERSTAITFSVGWRWTGVSELYATVKAGEAEPFCLD